ncbi:hypothetical protein A3A40_00365 [Candidatus Kaiserbacteria bacterium RIFCSPLOWO2_01_FULL_54_20]|uniref:Uncharacterized protein n=1 Tax=Candidatus Kaiserbacteria bacterium RIFCSPLOWO2_01_FULL_54_20 TaxID=1798513 RepID=A0A1F6ELH4_9BACT|nr:MAG: hypothetical protein A3A40_00365 [Candidatus Kaiserbacteria bacterium RIFCSPLOWO2_01_FULL_54_20]
MRKRRITKLIRVSEQWHLWLKATSIRYHKPISEVVDDACKHLSSEYERQNAGIIAQLKVLFPNRQWPENPPIRPKPSPFQEM